jgi:hypothetical protein
MDMKPSRFTEEQIIGILREQEAGALCWSRLFEQLFRFDKWNVCRG